MMADSSRRIEPLTGISESRRRLAWRSSPFILVPLALIVIEIRVPAVRHWAEHHPITTIFVTSAFVVGFTAFWVDQRARIHEQERAARAVLLEIYSFGSGAFIWASLVVERFADAFTEIKQSRDHSQVDDVISDVKRTLSVAVSAIADLTIRWRLLEYGRDITPVIDQWLATDRAIKDFAHMLHQLEPPTDDTADWQARVQQIDELTSLSRTLMKQAHDAREGLVKPARIKHLLPRRPIDTFRDLISKEVIASNTKLEEELTRDLARLHEAVGVPET